MPSAARVKRITPGSPTPEAVHAVRPLWALCSSRPLQLAQCPDRPSRGGPTTGLSPRRAPAPPHAAFARRFGSLAGSRPATIRIVRHARPGQPARLIGSTSGRRARYRVSPPRSRGRRGLSAARAARVYGDTGGAIAPHREGTAISLGGRLHPSMVRTSGPIAYSQLCARKSLPMKLWRSAGIIPPAALPLRHSSSGVQPCPPPTRSRGCRKRARKPMPRPGGVGPMATAMAAHRGATRASCHPHLQGDRLGTICGVAGRVAGGAFRASIHAYCEDRE